MTGASVNFKPVLSASHAVQHADRTVKPKYLLAPDVSLGTICLLDDKGKVAQTLDAKMALASRQAKAAKNFSPIWEGVLNLPRPDLEDPKFDVEAYKKHCIEITNSWINEYQKATNHKVLRADIHLDEGHIEDCKTLLNAHAHIISDKTNERGKVYIIDRKEMRALQDMTAKVTQLKRGEKKNYARKHMTPTAFKAVAKSAMLESQEKVNHAKLENLKRNEKQINDVTKKLTDTHASELAQLKAQIEADYKANRAAMVASKTATQADYKALKEAKDKEIAGLQIALKAAQTEAAKVPALVATVTSQADQIAKLNTQYQLDRAEFKRLNAEAAAAGLEKVKSQKDYQALKVAHDKALADLTKTQTEAAKVPKLEADLSKEKANSDYYGKLVDSQNQRSAEQSEKLKTAKTKITQLTEKVETMTTQINDLAEENAKLAADKAKFAAMAANHQADRAAGIPAHLIVPDPVPRTSQSNKQAVLTPAPIPREATRTPVEPPKQPEAPIPPPTPQKSLVERLGESWEAMLGWIKSIGAEQEPIGPNTRHDGPVKHLDDLHAVQKTGRRYAVHRLADLDKVPGLDDPRMVIRYKDGKGTVEGRTGPGVQI